MKKKDLEKALKQLGWWLGRQGARHELWTNGSEQEPVPRHNEIAEPLAKCSIAWRRPRMMERPQPT